MFKNMVVTFAVMLLIQPGNAQSDYPGQHAGKFAIEDKLVPKLYSFNL